MGDPVHDEPLPVHSYQRLILLAGEPVVAMEPYLRTIGERIAGTLCVFSDVKICTSEVMKVRDIILLIEEDGWRYHSQKGSHRQYKHAGKSGRVTIAGKPGSDMHAKTLAAVFRQAQIEKPNS